MTKWPLNMKAIRSFETSGIIHPEMHCRIPEYRNSQLTLRAKLETRAHTHTYTYTHTHTHSLTYTHTHTYTIYIHTLTHTHIHTYTHTQRILKQWDHTVSIKYAGTLTDLYQTADITTRPITCTTNRQLSYSCLLQYFTEPCLRHAVPSYVKMQR